MSMAVLMNSECTLCGNKCDGTLMRIDPRYKRVRAMITAPEVPRLNNGGIALCHTCQRYVYFQGGYLAMLARAVRRAAMQTACRQRAAAYNARRDARAPAPLSETVA